MGRQTNGTGSVHERKDGTVEYKVSLGIGADGKQLRKSFYGKDKKIAIRKYKDWLKDSGNVPIEKVKTVKEWSLKWLELYKKDKVAYGTYKNYKMYIDNHIVPALGNLRLEQVRPAHIQAFFKDDSRKNLSDSAKRHINIALKGIFDSAAENRFCKDSPVKPLKLNKTTAEDIKVFNSDEIKKMLADAKTHEHGILIQLLLYTGLRMGELLALQWTDIRDGVITVRRSLGKSEKGYKDKTTKSGKIRYVGITDKLQEVIESVPKKGLYVITDNIGSQLSPYSFEWRYKKFFKETDNKYLSPHKCRHTYATYLLKGGADLRSVQALLGHSNVNVTEIYTHIDTDDIKNNVKKLNY